VDFFVYSGDAAGTAALRGDPALLEEHWAYMDGFAGTMIARGPTLAPDRETATGSLHVLGLTSVAAAREFVDREPNNRAGVYAEHSIWRFENLLGRTMWDFAGADEPRFLVIARPGSSLALDGVAADRLILHGALADLDDPDRRGVAVALEAPDRASVDQLFPAAEIHDWEFGGRR
jgi:hypothetical protein